MTPRARLLTAFLSIFGVAAFAASTTKPNRQDDATPGAKITTRYTYFNGTAQQPTATIETLYLHADRKREELRNDSPAMPDAGLYSAVITRCDPWQVISLDFGDREYSVVPPTRSPRPEPSRPNPILRSQAPTLIIETTTVDTAERKTMFARQARHVITTEERIPVGPTILDSSEMVIDGWYIDFDWRLSCEAQQVSTAFLYAVQRGSPPPVVSFSDIGARETGYMVAGTKTTRSHDVLPDGTVRDVVVTEHQQVIEISQCRLDSGLFDPPADFRNVTPGSRGYYWKAGRQWLEHALRRFIG